MNKSATSPLLASRRRLRAKDAIPFVLLSVFTLQSFWFVNTQSMTYDEPAHIIAGVDAWRHGRFEHWNDHPPLGRLWLTLPIRDLDSQFVWRQLPSGYRVESMQPLPEEMAARTRPMNTLLGIFLGLALWFATRRLFSLGAANVALALFTFTPSLIANFSVATTDGIGTLFIFLVAFQLIRWRQKPNWWQTTLLGLALGGLLLAKFYAPPLVLLALLLMLVLKPDRWTWRPLQWNWSAALVALLLAVVTLWAGYFFHVSHLTVGDAKVTATFPNRGVKTWPTKSQLHLSMYVPAGEFFEGLREVAFSNKHGRPAWFFGKIYPTGGIKLYYLAAIALKWPTVLLALLLAALLMGVRRVCRAPGDLLVMCSFAVVFFLFAVRSRYDIGERHILPLYPFALTIAGSIWEHVVALKARIGAEIPTWWGPKRINYNVIVLLLVLALNAADALRPAPDYLAYFNVLVRPQNAWRFLTDSNLDWGQGLIAVREYEFKHLNEPAHLAYFGSVNPALYGVRALPLEPNQPVNGKVIAGLSALSGQVLPDPNSYRWLLNYKPSQMLDRSMFVYDVH
ncbi:MAG TPA: glycosyltransferase family 39 protein [Candidatus Binatia bacterium]|nr:glycosyltransferase family 39 protein [Candidatus Binatia bacterium]